MSLRIIEELPPSGKNRGKRVKAECHCGNIVEVRKSHIVSGNTTSCGCMQGKHPVKKKENSTSGHIRPQPQKPLSISLKKPIYIEPEENEEDDYYNEAEQFIERFIEDHNMTEDQVADKLGIPIYRLYQLSLEDLKEKLREAGAPV
jgi:hypothetical protein